jgi:hypothetical protein
VIRSAELRRTVARSWSRCVVSRRRAGPPGLHSPGQHARQGALKTGRSASGRPDEGRGCQPRQVGNMCPPERCGRPAVTLADRPRDGRTMQGSSISAVRIERTAHPVSTGRVSADQRRCVVRGGVEPPTFRFSGAIELYRSVAGRRLTGHLTAPIVPRRRPVSLGVRLRWLSVWLPRCGRRRAQRVTHL